MLQVIRHVLTKGGEDDEIWKGWHAGDGELWKELKSRRDPENDSFSIYHG
jgi:hypothetical protein